MEGTDQIRSLRSVTVSVRSWQKRPIRHLYENDLRSKL